MAKRACTRVVFRRFRPKHNYGYAEVIALFPGLKNGRYVTSYMHTGQHGDADYRHVVSMTTPTTASDADVKALAKELRVVGYKLCPAKRR
jgi:hypothetical protein